MTYTGEPASKGFKCKRETNEMIRVRLREAFKVDKLRIYKIANELRPCGF